jgi:hypothetical protein
MFERLKQQWQAWQDRKFLRRHRCDSWAEYHRIYDPDYNCHADRIGNFYHGYPYVYCFENHNHYIYQMIADYGPGGCRYGYHIARDWTEEHSQDKVRFDFHRVFKQPEYGTVTEEWWINEIGGQDLVFAAFKNERDYLMFTLRWA